MRPLTSPETIDEDAVTQMEEAIRAFYRDSRGEREVTKRARDMLTNLLRGHYRTRNGEMDRYVAKRFETTDDGDDRECRYRAEKCLAGLLYGIIDRYRDRTDREDAEQLFLSLSSRSPSLISSSGLWQQSLSNLFIRKYGITHLVLSAYVADVSPYQG